MFVRTYGTTGPWVATLHGGPGAPGGMAPVARELAGAHRVLEPWQRGSGEASLTVARHVEDLRELITERCPGERPALVGASWGAMLALAFAAAHPDLAGPLVLIGCGTFDPEARERLQATREERTDPETRALLERLMSDPSGEADHQLEAVGAVLLKVDSYELATTDTEAGPVDARALAETWADMLRLQREGVYPAAFAAFRGPVLMLHGAHDPHPGRMIRNGLLSHLPQLEYRELGRCGHYPWLERHARGEFFEALKGWLERRTDQAPS